MSFDFQISDYHFGRTIIISRWWIVSNLRVSLSVFVLFLLRSFYRGVIWSCARYGQFGEEQEVVQGLAYAHVRRLPQLCKWRLPLFSFNAATCLDVEIKPLQTFLNARCTCWIIYPEILLTPLHIKIQYYVAGFSWKN